MPGWHPVVLITLLSSGMLSNSQVRALKMCHYVKFCVSLLSLAVFHQLFKSLGGNVLSVFWGAIPAVWQVSPSSRSGWQWAGDSTLLHSGCAADFTWKSWWHVFIYMPFILTWLPILIAEFLDFEANCAPSQPLLPQADKQECDWK